MVVPPVSLGAIKHLCVGGESADLGWRSACACCGSRARHRAPI